MKFITFFIAASLLAIGTKAQNYSCLQAGVKHYFTNSDGYLRGIRVDSMSVIGSDKFFYLYRTPRGNYPAWSGGSVVLDSTGGSWLGKTVLQKSDGTFLFDNSWLDTVVIKTQAQIGDPWTFYDDTSNNYYVATLTAVDTLSILGATDSIKRITIAAYNGSGIDVSDAFHNVQIILSKNHGFVEVFDLYNFPYHPPGVAYRPGFDYYVDVVGGPTRRGSIFTLIDFINPTWAQLHDADSGDVFQYTEYAPGYCLRCSYPICSYYPLSYYVDSVQNKTISASDVRIDYRRLKATQHYDMMEHYLYHEHYPYDISVYARTQLFSFDFLVDTLRMPEEYGQSTLLFYFPRDSTYCMKSPLYTVAPSEMTWAKWTGFFERAPPTRKYKMGLGMVYFFEYDAGRDLTWNTTLTYYKKRGVSCGGYVVPKPVKVANVLAAKGAFKLQPNPANALLDVFHDDRIYTIVIYDLLGRRVFNATYNAAHVQVDIAQFQPGVYLITVNGERTEQFVKQ